MVILKNIVIGFLIYFTVAFVICGIAAIIFLCKKERTPEEQKKLDDEQMHIVSKMKKK
jgi:hypothetical protein